ncbi:MFS transporter [Gordonia terrae]|nr:MFS transporter [Gordonia terrae]ANY25883.1 MFS transporter [Gordonia terrae]GAB43387.1 putative major facilitator superfamily transporter [Gordonia terrae NBRC 100016]VTR06833.1 transporter protein [Clostridioides difficile]VTS36607.1 Proline porter II [Gordonia terrae]
MVEVRQVQASVEATPGRQSPNKVLRAGLLGTVVEYYDLAIYGLMATVLGAKFFAAEDEGTAVLATFATFAVAFFVRIPGGIVFGQIGDKYGRKPALTATILLMTGATALIGVLPSYATWGIWATIVLVLCRSVQGFAAGGELGGANVLVAESAPARRRGLYTSVVNMGSTLGSILASIVALTLASMVSEEVLYDWAWRVAFLLSVVLGTIGLWIRVTLEDSPEFDAVKASDEVEVHKVPVLALLRTARKEVGQIILMLAIGTGGYYVASVYSTSYLQIQGDHSPSFAFLCSVVALGFGTALLPVSGMLGDRFGRRPVLVCSAGIGVVVAFPAFILMGSGSVVGAIVGQSILFGSVCMVNGTAMVTALEMLSARVRYSGLALGINTANTLLGGTAPFVAALLVNTTGNALAPAGLFTLVAVLSLIGALTVTGTRKLDLSL